ncbi:hypothetical protein CCM_00289 [Cordyceps militaris CM01]|uniref:CCZ1/INTU/HSP4 first Longin domain-containing protein n=1 Tax=Cordyceps militaris (strain CM01) TaxID=983644 RepID=G3J3A5_CORMM|nr:uncharacterized protein CCM_00289 [Cordyceps militaris CM01]EGX95635.1 hypothetical protein CCM_00289 [Cordyceps militaris CM01]
MNEIYEKLAAAGQLATCCGEAALEFDNSARVCDIYEVWVHNDSGDVVPRLGQVDASAVPGWLRDSHAGNPGHTLLLRLVLVTIRTAGTARKLVGIAKDTHRQLTKAFGLELAHEFLKGTVTSVTAFPAVAVAPAGAERYCYAFNHAPKLAAIWSQLRPATAEGCAKQAAATEGIIYITDGAGGDPAQKRAATPATASFAPGDVLRRLLQSPFCADVYASSMAPALLLAMQLGFETDLAQSRIKVAIRAIEAATGYHTFKSRVAASSTHARLSQLAVRASGSATKLASVDRKSTSMQKVLRFVVKELDREAVGPADTAAQRLLRHHVGVLEERLEMQMLDTRYTMKRVDIQINAAQIFNMMTQEDALNGIELAQSTHLIAHASYRDSSSMKTLAIVTMFFLPGSFVSAMFSMPMYEWAKADPESPFIGVGLLPQFRLYWVITLPLTTVIFGFYLWWLWHLKRQRDAEFDSVSRKSADSSDGEEGDDVVEERRLARKRRQTTLMLAIIFLSVCGGLASEFHYSSRLCAPAPLRQPAMAVAAPAPRIPVPAQLGFLAIYNPSLGTSDDTIDDQIVYYASVTSQSVAPAKRRRARTRGRPTDGISPEERNERLRQIGLAQGMVSFSQGFTDGEPVDAIETETTRVVVRELESGWWILASIDLNKTPLPPRLLTKNSEPQEEKYDYNTKEMKPAALILRDLQRAHRIFLMHHDVSMSSLFLRLPRHKFVAVLTRYWDLYLSTWSVSLHGNPARDIYQGINIAASGELGVGVGEEERGSGEREVLEGLVGRTEGLVDLMVSKFGGEDGDETDSNSNAPAPWLGSGREPSIDDGAIFLGTGALSRKSLRDVTHWMEDLYTWGEHAYGVIESPISTRKTRTKKTDSRDDIPKTSEADTKGSSRTNPAQTSTQSNEPTAKQLKDKKSDPLTSNPSSATTDTGTIEEGKGVQVAKSQVGEVEDGKLDKMVSYLKLGYGQYWTIPGVASLSGSSTDQAADPKERPSSKAAESAPPKRPTLPKPSPSQESAGHYLIGLKGEIEEAYGGVDDGGAEASDESDSERDSRTVLRTIHVELDNNESGSGFPIHPPQQNPAAGATLTEAQMRGSLRPGANVQENSNAEKLRVVVYVNRPFLFVFLFRLRTDSLAWDALYRSLHYQLAPLRRPLLTSTRYRPERPDTGGRAAGIYDLVWNPFDLTVHTTVPNIPDDHLHPAGEPSWSRADAVNTHLHVLHVYSSTRSPRVTDLERTQKTSRGWWIVWTRLVLQQHREAGSSRAVAMQTPRGGGDGSGVLSAPPSPRLGSEAGGDELGGSGFLGPAVTSKEIVLIRRASDHVSSVSSSLMGGGGVDSVGRLAQGIGVDTRRYVEDLLSML